MFFKTRNILNKNDLTCEGTVYMKMREKGSKNKKKFLPPVPKIVFGRLEGNLSTIPHAPLPLRAERIGVQVWIFINMNQYIVIFECSVFLTVYSYLMTNLFLQKITLAPPELRSVGIVRLSLTVWEIKMFEFSTFWQCASKCIRNIFALKVSFKN